MCSVAQVSNLFKDTHKEQYVLYGILTLQSMLHLKVMRSAWCDTKVTTGTRNLTVFWEGHCKHSFQWKFLQQYYLFLF